MFMYNHEIDLNIGCMLPIFSNNIQNLNSDETDFESMKKKNNLVGLGVSLYQMETILFDYPYLDALYLALFSLFKHDLIHYLRLIGQFTCLLAL